MHATGQGKTACGKIEDVLEGLKQEEPGWAEKKTVWRHIVMQASEFHESIRVVDS
jgi:hypothetical protein